MNVNTLTRKQFVSAPVEKVFGFFARPENLAELTPPDLGFVILTPGPITMKQGALIDYTIRLLGVPVRWTTIITSYEPGRSFVDEQLKGPYSFWHHSHFFEEAPGGTLVRDEIRYALPFGPVGELVRRLAVEKRLRSIFDYRATVIGRMFGRGESTIQAASGTAAVQKGEMLQ